MKKTLRVLAVLLAVASLFVLTASATPFSPSIERKPGPTLMDEDVNVLLVTPLAHLYREDIVLHEDIRNSLKKAEEQLKQDTWVDEVPGLAEAWKKATYGAPQDHIVITDIFDVRYRSELGSGKTEGEDLTFKLVFQDMTADDVFLIVGKTSEEEGWQVVDYVIRGDDVVIITSKSMSAFAVLRDSGLFPPTTPDAPDSPHTAVSPYLIPAIAGALVFAAAAVFCVLKLRKRTEA